MPRRRFRGPVRPERPSHRVNERIRFPQIKVISAEGENLGVMSPDEGREHAREAGLDLVEVAPNIRPPVCKILDYGKFKYERAKRHTNQNSSTVKTIQLRPKTDTHDLETKLGHARKFLQRGDKVKVVMRLRGRERAFVDRAVDILKTHIQEGLGDDGRIATAPAHQGRMISVMVEPSS